MGLPIFSEAAAGAPCDRCGQALDVFGDHLVACSKSGAWSRHNQCCSSIAAIASATGLSVRAEVPIQGRRRPADMLLGHWFSGQDAAVDPTVVHCLNPSYPWDWRKPAVEKAELAKHEHSDRVCAAAGLSFLPVGADTFGAYGGEGRRFLGQLFSRYAKRLTHDDEVTFPGHLQHECWQRVSVALHKAVAKQLCSAYDQMGGPWSPPPLTQV